MINSLTEKRKTDRVQMAKQVTELAQGLGLNVVLDTEFAGPREIKLDIEHSGGARISVNFDGDSCQPDVYVGSWYMDYKSNAKFSRAFGVINPYHQRKATFVAHGFEALLIQLKRDIECLNSGDGYDKVESFAQQNV